MLAGGVLIALVGLMVWMWWGRSGGTEADTPQPPTSASQAASPDDLKVSAEILATAGVETVPVTPRSVVERVHTTGVVEPNQQQIQQVTPLIAGRVERVAVALGNRVQAGSVLLTLSSPQIAEMQGSLRAAEAKLAEADATLTRTKQLVELGAGAGKDLVAADAESRTAQAQVTQLRQGLEALGSSTDAGSTVTIRAPMTGTIIERAVNPGAWTEVGKSLFTIANLTTVWVIVNIPEARLGLVRPGAHVEIRAPALGNTLPGRVSYIDPQLDQATRTARARVEATNTGELLKIGMFVDATVDGPMQNGTTQLTVPVDAIQRIGERSVVFVPATESGHFTVRDVEVGDEIQGARVVLQGLTSGDRVVTKGGFTLKSQLLKGQFGEDEELGKK